MGDIVEPGVVRLYRERDVLDYLTVLAVLGLAYLHFPWRAQVRAAVDGAVATLLTTSAEAGLPALLLVGVLGGAAFLYYLAEIVPKRG